MRATQERLQRQDRLTAVRAPGPADLAAVFFGLARVKASLCAEIDRSLGAEHDLTYQAFDAMSVISERLEGCGEGALASVIGLTPEATRALVESLVASGFVRRTVQSDDEEPGRVMLTLRGTLVLNRAGRIVDRELARTIGSALSPEELSELEDALGRLRPRPGPTREPLSAHARHARRAVRRCGRNGAHRI